MVNVFDGSKANGPGNLQVMKNVVVTVGKYKDYIDEIQQSYELGFTSYRLHKNVDCTFVTLICVSVVFVTSTSPFIRGGICIGRCCYDGGWRSKSYNGYNKQ